MTASYQPDLTLEDFADFLSGGQLDQPDPEPQPESTVLEAPASRPSRSQVTPVEQSAKPRKASAANGNGQRDKQSSTTLEHSREMMQVVTALSNLKSELKQAGLLQKGSIKQSFLQVTEFIATLPKPSEQNMPLGVSQLFQYQREQVMAVAEQMRQAQDFDALMKVVLMAVQQALPAERVVIYRFDSMSTGQVVVESVARGFTPMMGSAVVVPCFGEERAEDYAIQPVAVDDTDRGGLTPYQRQLFDQYQIKSSLSLSISPAGKPWGILAVHQCSKARVWKEAEVNLLNQICLQLAIHLGRFESSLKLKQQVDLEKAVNKLMERIRQSTDIDKIFRTTTQEVRQLLRTDRVAVYQFKPDWSGEFIAESVGNGWTKLVGVDFKMAWEDTHLQETQGGRYRKNESFSVDDIYKVGHAQCHIDMLEQVEAKAYMIVPVFMGQRLWGLLAAYQNSEPRHWEEYELAFLTQISNQFSSALQFAQAYRDLQRQGERKTLIASIFDRVRQSVDLPNILKSTIQDVRQQLKADRVGIYRFNLDWSGEFIAESVGAGWLSVLNLQDNDVSLRAGAINQERCVIKTWSTTSTSADTDTYLKETQGGAFAKGDRYTQVDDIYKMNFSACYLTVLEKYQCRAYLTVPIFQGGKLWGLLAVYQNTGARRWEKADAELLIDVSEQLGSLVRQAELLREAQLRADREKNLSRIVENVRKSLDVKSIFRTITQELRQQIRCDRVAIYKFNPDWSGEFVADSAATGWEPIAGPGIRTVWADTHLQDTQGGRYRNNETYAVDDIYKAGHFQCHIEILEQFQI
nr:GAF domain-containing protein [Oculatellaceae cyanobacterium Prado106]